VLIIAAMDDLITTIVAKEAVDVAKGFLVDISKDTSSAVGGLIGDRVNYWRFKNRINLLLESRQFLIRKGIKPEKILPDIFVPLIEEGGNTEDEGLSAMFASLLASHLDPNTQNEVHPSFAKVLAQLSSLDARVIADIYRVIMVRKLGKRHGIITDNVCEKYKVPRETALLTFENLWRLGICGHGTDLMATVNDGNYACFSDFGWSFAKACLSHLTLATPCDAESISYRQ